MSPSIIKEITIKPLGPEFQTQPKKIEIEIFVQTFKIAGATFEALLFPHVINENITFDKSISSCQSSPCPTAANLLMKHTLRTQERRLVIISQTRRCGGTASAPARWKSKPKSTLALNEGGSVGNIGLGAPWNLEPCLEFSINLGRPVTAAV